MPNCVWKFVDDLRRRVERRKLAGSGSSPFAMSPRAASIERQHRKRCLFKYDGYRCLVKKHNERVELLSRPGNALNRSFPDIVEAVAAVRGDFVFDAELTVDKPSGQSDFNQLSKRAKTSVASRVRAAALAHPARLYAFDLHAIGHRDLRGLPLIERKARLRDTFEDTATLVFVNGIVEAGEWVFEQVSAHDFEGMLGKRLDSLYQRGRSHDSQKVKFAGYSRPAA